MPIIEKTDVLEDHKENEVVRVAHFKDQSHQAAHTVKEVCRSYYPTKVSHLSRRELGTRLLIPSKVDFIQPNGAVITNTVSDGPGLTENDLNMTYTFNWIHDDVAEGSDEHKKLEQQYRNAAKNAVHKSIEALHRMAAAGELN